MDDLKLIPIDKIPFQIMKPRGKKKYPISESGIIVKRFIESNYKMVYIQLNSKRELHLMGSKLIYALNRWGNENVKCRQHTQLLRVYLLKTDEINHKYFENDQIIRHKLIPVKTLPEEFLKHKKLWTPIIEKFIKTNNKLAYIEIENEKDLRRARGGLYTAGKKLNVKVYLYSYYNRIYLERTDLDITGEIS